MPSDWKEGGTLRERARLPATLSLSRTMKLPSGSRDSTFIAKSLENYKFKLIITLDTSIVENARDQVFTLRYTGNICFYNSNL
jgi:hypothetical protein